MKNTSKCLVMASLLLLAAICAHTQVLFTFQQQTRKVLYYPKQRMLSLGRNEYLVGIKLSPGGDRRTDPDYVSWDVPYVNKWYLSDTVIRKLQSAMAHHTDVSLIAYTEKIKQDPTYGKIVTSNMYVFDLTPQRLKKHTLWAINNYDAQTVDTLGF